MKKIGNVFLLLSAVALMIVITHQVGPIFVRAKTSMYWMLTMALIFHSQPIITWIVEWIQACRTMVMCAECHIFGDHAHTCSKVTVSGLKKQVADLQEERYRLRLQLVTQRKEMQNHIDRIIYNREFWQGKFNTVRHENNKLRAWNNDLVNDLAVAESRLIETIEIAKADAALHLESVKSFKGMADLHKKRYDDLKAEWQLMHDKLRCTQ